MNDSNLSIAEALSGKLVLIVDDEHPTLAMLRAFLVNYGVPAANIKTYSDGDEVIEFVQKTSQPIGLALLDWMMPKVSGIKVLQYLKSDKKLRHIPVLMITARGKESDIVMAIEEKASDYIVKPFTNESLKEKLVTIFFPPDHVRFLAEAEGLIEEGDYEDATIRLNEVMKLKPDSANARLLMGRIFQLQGDTEKSEEWYTEAAEKNPNFIKVYTSLATLYEANKDYERALLVLSYADQLSPDLASRKVSIGKLSLDSGDSEYADEMFRKAIDLDPDTVDEVVDICAKRGASNLALDYINMAVAKRRQIGDLSDDEIADYIDKYNRAGIEFRRKGLWNEAITTYKCALRIDPENFVLYFNIGVAFAKLPDHKEAKEFLLKAKELNEASDEPDSKLSGLVDREIKQMESK